MKFQAEIDGQERTVELTPAHAAGDARRIVVEGREWTADIVEVEAGIFSVLIGGQSFEVRVAGGVNGAASVEVNGRRVELVLRDPRRYARGGSAAAAGPQMLKAVMPGRVVRLLAAPGDAIEQGQGVLVLEAMKMQNEVRASRAGVLREVFVAEGGSVAAGQPLARIE